MWFHTGPYFFVFQPITALILKSGLTPATQSELTHMSPIPHKRDALTPRYSRGVSNLQFQKPVFYYCFETVSY
jgi:hypothetical protein